MNDSIVESIITNPQDWRMSEYTFDNKKLNVSIWKGTFPVIDLKLYPNSIPMSLSRKYRIYKAIKWWSDNAPVECLSCKS